jgi:5,10-methylene-tetrahydrofolate dehydrogenase/methenyl tetrahydrofolate cyclohydrolase
MYLEDKKAFVPATPGAVMEILDYYKIRLKAKMLPCLADQWLWASLYR